jgi:hypothetical protein
MKHRFFASFCASALLCLSLSTGLAGWLEKIRDPVKMKKYLESSFTAPASVSIVQRMMETQGFTCSLRTDATFKKQMHYLYCVRQVDRPEPGLWEIAFEIAGNGMLNGEVDVIKTYPKTPAVEAPPR